MCDWTAAEHEYVTGDTGYREIAKRYGVSSTAVGAYAKKNKWVQKRKEFKDDTCARLIQKTADRVADAISRTQTNVYEAAALLSEKLLADIQAIRSLKSYEYGHYAGALKTLHDLLPQAQMEADDQEQKFVALLPERTEIEE